MKIKSILSYLTELSEDGELVALIIPITDKQFRIYDPAGNIMYPTTFIRREDAIDFVIRRVDKIEDEDDYNQALVELRILWGSTEEPAVSRLEFLIDLIDEYEDIHYPMGGRADVE